MKKLFVIASLISSCILFSCEKEPININGKTNGLDLNLFGGAGWCKSAVKPGGSAAHVNQPTNTTVGLHPGTETPKR